MTGKPQRSGGKRVGAGPPIRKWTLRTGDVMAAWEQQDGSQIGAGRLATIEVKSRNVLVVKFDDGTEIKLVR
jgi:hypothetical protein